MTAGERDMIERWMTLSREDLSLAEIAIERGMFRPGLFHCQQAAEKALKGTIAAGGELPPRIHDLPLLLTMCGRVHGGFDERREDAERLSAYAVQPRYPTLETSEEYSEEEAGEALASARRIVTFVEEVLDRGT